MLKATVRTTDPIRYLNAINCFNAESWRDCPPETAFIIGSGLVSEENGVFSFQFQIAEKTDRDPVCKWYFDMLAKYGSKTKPRTVRFADLKFDTVEEMDTR
jgi:hypothetical protein